MPAIKVFVWALLASTALPPASVLAAEPHDARLPGGEFATVLPPAPGVKTTVVAPFRMDRKLVSNADFARFVLAEPRWRRDGVARLFADTGYLEHWQSAATPGANIANQPVTHVSWFAASAYCEARGQRLPRWHEWEYAAAASESRPDARGDAGWRQQVLDWYARSARAPLPSVGATPANYFGVRDLHGVAWEWVEDAGGMLVSDDGREQGDGSGRFCGAGAATFEQKENYAMLMRIAMLSSMKAAYTSASMSFRCVREERPE
jgi:sulfatase modifying factor 1